MATVHLDDALFRRLQASADARGSSVEAEAARFLDRSLSEEHGALKQAAVDGMIERLGALHHRQRADHEGPLPDSTELIRQMREEEEVHLLRVVRGER